MKFLTLEQFTEMWKLQDELNSKTSGENWKELNQNWNLAIKSEVMEFFDYIGWKWWKEPDQKKKPSDMQARLELVDIWHFLLSDIIQRKQYAEPWKMLSKAVPDHDDFNFSDWKEAMMEMDASFGHAQKINNLCGILRGCEWTWDELYKAYIGKVALNNFRQANGYKEGTYQKIWDQVGDDYGHLIDREDNYFLEKIMAHHESLGKLTYQRVYDHLAAKYADVTS